MSIGALAIAHDMPSALSGILGASIFRALGAPLPLLALFSLPQLANALRLLWAPLLDNGLGGRFMQRTPWIVATAFAAMTTYLVTGAIAPSLDTLVLIIALLTVAQVFMATFDIAIEAFVVENLEPRQRGVGAAVFSAGKEVGQLISIAGLGIVIQQYGWRTGFTLAGVAIFLLSISVLLTRERRRTARPADGGASLLSFFREASWPRMLGTLFFVNYGRGLFVAAFGPFLVDKGMSIGQIGAAAGVANTVATVAAMTLGAMALRRLGVRRLALVMLPVSMTAVFPVFWLVLADAPTLVQVIWVVLWATLVTAPLLLCVMTARLGWTSEGQVGTDFTIQSSAFFLGYVAALVTAGPLAELTGWVGFFVVQGVVMFSANLGFVLLHDRICDDMAAWRRSERTPATPRAAGRRARIGEPAAGDDAAS